MNAHDGVYWVIIMPDNKTPLIEALSNLLRELLTSGFVFCKVTPLMNDWLIVTYAPAPTSPVAEAAGGWRLSPDQRISFI